ncbi:MAG TPA: methyltransferase domain-containing protein [Acidimicrobiales bacterium]|jgi:ubiquinone/menaquinone biosynthesis C-methylase UbiE|nr:methyltransferase domain-containing protein [Acidimicrobiales bacterium]
MTYAEQDLITTIDRLVPEGATVGTTPEALQYLDQYHAGGSQAVDRLLATLTLSPSDTVLDIGCGLGGPARQVATASGCRVTGVDITEAYLEAAAELTDRCGLSDRVRFIRSDIADLGPEQPFDAAYTMHVQMNIEAKRQWFSEIAPRLAPRARFAVWEVCRTSDAELSWPLPWSMDGSDSYLATSDDLRDTILGAGFELVEWVDESGWVTSWFDSTFADGLPSGPTLPLLLEDGFVRMLNFAGAIADGTVGVRRGAFVRSAD